MMRELRGMSVVTRLAEDAKERVRILQEHGITPKLTVVRVGAREDDLAYEKGLTKRFSSVGAVTEIIECEYDISQEKLEQIIDKLNQDEFVHGILVFCPLPKHLDEGKIRNRINSQKDVDCLTSLNCAHVFAQDEQGFSPCTPQAVMELLKFYELPLSGKKAVVVGRSMVVGKPLAMMLLKENATVTICHTRTQKLEEECQKADYIFACAGSAKMIKSPCMKEGQILIDVGINYADGKLCGDIDYDAAQEIVCAATPVPGGVGSVTTSVLLKHTIQSACRILE